GPEGLQLARHHRRHQALRVEGPVPDGERHQRRAARGRRGPLEPALPRRGPPGGGRGARAGCPLAWGSFASPAACWPPPCPLLHARRLTRLCPRGQGACHGEPGAGGHPPAPPHPPPPAPPPPPL